MTKQDRAKIERRLRKHTIAVQWVEAGVAYAEIYLGNKTVRAIRAKDTRSKVPLKWFMSLGGDWWRELSIRKEHNPLFFGGTVVRGLLALPEPDCIVCESRRYIGSDKRTVRPLCILLCSEAVDYMSTLNRKPITGEGECAPRWHFTILADSPEGLKLKEEM